MKPANWFVLWMMIGAVPIWLSLLSKPLGIPSPWDLVLMAVGVFCIFIGRNAKGVKGDKTTTTSMDVQMRARKKFSGFMQSL